MRKAGIRTRTPFFVVFVMRTFLGALPPFRLVTVCLRRAISSKEQEKERRIDNGEGYHGGPRVDPGWMIIQLLTSF